MNIRKWILLPILAGCILLCACGQKAEVQASPTPVASFSENVVPVVNDAAAATPAPVADAPVPEVQIPAVTPTPAPDPTAAYAGIVDTYTTALREGYTTDRCISANINYMVGYYTSGGRAGDLGYCFYDVNGDGIPELVIGEDQLIIAMYTLQNGQPVQVIDGGERSRYYLEPDGVIVNVGSGSAFLSAYTFYTLQNGRLVANNALVSDYSVNEAEPWFYAEDDDWDVSNDSHISTEKALSWIKAYEDNYVTLPYRPFLN